MQNTALASKYCKDNESWLTSWRSGKPSPDKVFDAHIAQGQGGPVLPGQLQAGDGHLHVALQALRRPWGLEAIDGTCAQGWMAY